MPKGDHSLLLIVIGFPFLVLFLVDMFPPLVYLVPLD